MRLEQVARVLEEAARVTNHRQFVIVGSLSALGALVDPPPRMVQSIDVDLFPKLDPGRVAEINAALGEASDFARRHGFYADGVAPGILSAPEGWDARLVPVSFPSGVVGWFLEPNDAAVAKLIRGEQNDLEWVQAGVAAGVLSAVVVEARIRQVRNCLAGETDRALARLRRVVGRG